MNTDLVNEVIACLGDKRKLNHYHNDAFAVYLLENYCLPVGHMKVSTIKQSKYSKLLNRELVKQFFASNGKGDMNGSAIQFALTDNWKSYLLTLSSWGSKSNYGWSQTSLPGSNLVLQVNLTNKHDKRLRKLMIDDTCFKYYSHPIHKTRSSLAWARIDFDFDTNEALIEEIQSDWIRKARYHYKRSAQALDCGKATYRFGSSVYGAE